jgi:hypothetical protein
MVPHSRYVKLVMNLSRKERTSFGIIGIRRKLAPT